MATSTGRNIIKDITKYSGTDDEKNYQLQTRLSTYNQNNPSSVLKQSQEFSNETDSNGNKKPLGGELNEYLNNNNNAPSQDNTKALYSNEFPFWDFNCKGKINNKVTEVTKNEESVITETENEESEITETENKENFGNVTHKSTNVSIMIVILIVLVLLALLFAFLWAKSRKK